MRTGQDKKRGGQRIGGQAGLTTNISLGGFKFEFEVSRTRNVWQCLAMFGHVWQCLDMFENVGMQCLAMFGNVFYRLHF